MDSLSKKYYTVGEVAELLGLPMSTLRFWEKKFTVVKPERSATGRRLYTPADIDKIEMIAYLVKTQGLKLEAAEAQLRANPKGVSRRSAALTRLRAIRAEVKALYDATLLK
ncbi:MAG: MerR family transcriptional regulator [Pseudoflavonifractor sp.]|nr:MerR family transcriptional regulator [Alloprevotella sp.]MCM1117108.1 MerR family transcriptional regulator [Pseudoflavonifractor sp.]